MQIQAQTPPALPAVGQYIIQIACPPAFGYAELSQLLGRSPATLQADFSRNPGSLPPAHKPPHTKNPVWLLAEVLAWLQAQPAKELQPPVPRGAHRLGAPAKSESVAARQAGLSVKAYRAQQAQGGAS